MITVGELRFLRDKSREVLLVGPLTRDPRELYKCEYPDGGFVQHTPGWLESRTRPLVLQSGLEVWQYNAQGRPVTLRLDVGLRDNEAFEFNNEVPLTVYGDWYEAGPVPGRGYAMVLPTV